MILPSSGSGGSTVRAGRGGEKVICASEGSFSEGSVGRGLPTSLELEVLDWGSFTGPSPSDSVPLLHELEVTVVSTCGGMRGEDSAAFRFPNWT